MHMKRWLGARVYISWFVAVGSLAIVIGIAFAPHAPLGMFSALGWLLSGLTLVLSSLWHSRRWMFVLVVVGGGLIGLWRGSLVLTDLTMYEPLYGNELTLRGVVLEDKDTSPRGQTVLRIGKVVINDVALTGTLWVTVDTGSDIKRSDKVRIKGQLAEGFGTFAGVMYSAELIETRRDTSADPALAVRDWFANGVERALKPVEASLGLGYLTGQRRGLPQELDAALQAAGLTHIVVASGYNLTILVRFARRLFENVSKYLSFVTAGGMILSFIAITGMSPSMSRAGLVAGLSLIAWYYGRRFHPMVLLPFAMGVTVLVQPSYAWGDIGWMLSFAAFAGVMIMAPLMNAYFFEDADGHPIRRIMIETISAQIATLPILMATFGTVSVIAPIANILILPLVPLAMALTFVAGIGGLMLPTIAMIIGFPAQALLQYMTTTATYLGQLPWALAEIDVSFSVALAMYAVLALAILHLRRVTSYSLHQSSIVE